MDAVLMSRCQTISKLLLQVCLLGLFLHFFGRPAVERYLEKKVIVVTSVEKAESIPIPAITIAVNGASSGNGWKKQGAVQKIVRKFCKEAKTVETLNTCIERETYNLSEISSGIKMGLGLSTGKIFANKSELKDQDWIEDYTHTYFGRIYTFNHSIQLKTTSYLKGDSIRIDLNEEVEAESYYELYFHDPKYFYINMNSEAGYPMVRKVVYPETLPEYYPIAFTEVVELPNLTDDPCIEDPEYDYKACIKEYMIKQVGCRTKWDNANYPLCTRVKEFESFEWFYQFQIIKDARAISSMTGCMKPCKYKKYRLLGESRKLPFNESLTNGLLLWSMTDDKMVETEELIYPWESFLAEFGGCLGLFLGFSFMTIWDLFGSLKNSKLSWIFSLSLTKSSNY